MPNPCLSKQQLHLLPRKGTLERPQMGSLFVLLFLFPHLLSSLGVSAQNNGYSPGGTVNLGKPSVAIVIGIFSLVFAFTALLFVCAKFCQIRRPQYSFDVYPEGRSQFPSGLILEENPRFSGAEKDLIEMLPFFKFSELKGSKEGLECAVCLAKFDDADALRLLPKCKHAFHVSCIDRWLESHSSCPLCRQRVVIDDVTVFMASSSSRFLFRGSAGDPGPDLIVERESDSRDFHRFKHRIIVSDVVFKNRWSDLNAADLISLNSEMLGTKTEILMEFGGASSSNAGKLEDSSSRNNRVMSEIVRVPRFRDGTERTERENRWLPMAKKTLQWLAKKEKKGPENQEIGRTGLSV